MKKVITKNLFYIAFMLFSFSSISQDCLTRDSIFEKYDEKLINSQVILVDSVSQAELVKRAKNWGGTAFVNLKEVLVAETDNQLVFVYITSNTGGLVTTKDYIRLVIQFKDGRVKASFYDDGNTYYPASQYSSAVAARTYYRTDSFPKPESTICNNLLNRPYYKIFKSYKAKVLSSMEELKQALKKSSTVLIDDF